MTAFTIVCVCTNVSAVTPPSLRMWMTMTTTAWVCVCVWLMCPLGFGGLFSREMLSSHAFALKRVRASIISHRLRACVSHVLIKRSVRVCVACTRQWREGGIWFPKNVMTWPKSIETKWSHSHAITLFGRLFVTAGHDADESIAPLRCLCHEVFGYVTQLGDERCTGLCNKNIY